MTNGTGGHFGAVARGEGGDDSEAFGHRTADYRFAAVGC